MITKNSEIAANVIPVVSPIANVATDKPIKKSLVSDKDYRDIVGKSGNPGRIGCIETRLYTNDNINGTSFVMLAVLSTLGTLTKKVYNLKDLIEAKERFTPDNKSSLIYYKEYLKYSGKSKNPKSKLSAVYDATRRNIEIGVYKGVDLSSMASENVRKVFGFTF